MTFYFRKIPFFACFFLACFSLAVTSAHSQGKEEDTGPAEETLELLEIEPVSDSDDPPEPWSSKPSKNNGRNSHDYVLRLNVPVSTNSGEIKEKPVSLPIRSYSPVHHQHDSPGHSDEPDGCPEHSRTGACNCNSAEQKSNNANSITSQPRATIMPSGSSNAAASGEYTLSEISENNTEFRTLPPTLPATIVYGRESISILAALLQSLEKDALRLSDEQGFLNRYCVPLFDCTQPGTTVVKFWGSALLSLAVSAACVVIGFKYVGGPCGECGGEFCKFYCTLLGPAKAQECGHCCECCCRSCLSYGCAVYSPFCACAYHAAFVNASELATSRLKPVTLKIRLRHRPLAESNPISFLSTEITQRFRQFISRLYVRDTYPFIRAIRTVSPEGGDEITETHLTIQTLVPVELTSISDVGEYLGLDIVNNESRNETIVIQPGTTRLELEPNALNFFQTDML